MLVLFATFAGCAEHEEVWGIPRETFSQRLERGDYEFLRHLDYRELDLEEVTRLRAGAAYYLSRVYGELGLDSMRAEMLEVELQQGSEPWRRMAADDLVSLLGAEERYGELRRAAERALELYPGEPAYAFARYAALYEQKQDAQILSALTENDGDLRSFLERGAFDSRRREVELWRVVALYRLDEDGWDDAVRRFFLDFPAGPEHSRLYVFLIARSAAQEPFTAAELSLFSAKARVSEGELEEAARIFLELAEEARPGRGPAGAEMTPWLVRDMGRAFLRAGFWTRGIDILGEYAHAGASEALRARAAEYRGRMYRAAGNAAAAARELESAFQLQSGAAGKRRILWHLTDARMAYDPAAAVDDLARYGEGILAEGYFGRLSDRLASRIVQEGAWGELERAGRLLEDAGLPTAAEQFLYLAAEAALRAKPGAPPLEEASGLLAEIDSDPYYRLLSAVRRGRTEALLADSPRAGGPASSPGGEATRNDAGGEADGSSASAGDGGAEDGTGVSGVINGYLSFGLYRDAYDGAMAQSDELAVEDIELLAERLQSRGLLIESLRLMARARSREEFVLTPKAARLLYPRAFSLAMEQVAEREGIDLAVFYGLVREESHFSADIVSHAGATGLAQLMPSTAADMARRMRIAEPDLTDPMTNLSIGGFYLSYLLGRFDDRLLPALAAYNGGQGRVRSWLGTHRSLSGPLFHEAIPIRETRHYIRKVLVSAAYYGEIYDGRSIGETVRLFYPDLEAVGEATS
jgi:soluble lytic murein transglycosylase